MEQFDEILNEIEENMKDLNFKEKNIGNTQLNFTHDIYRKRFACNPKDSYYNIGFRFDENGFWAYVDFSFPNKEIERAKDIHNILNDDYKLGKTKDGHQVVTVERLEHFEQENGEVDTKAIENWFKAVIKEVKTKEAEIIKILT